MRIIRNERRINVLGTIGKYGALGGFLILLAGLVITWVRSDLLLIMMISLPVGTILTVIGGMLTDRYAGPLAHHDTLAGALKGLGNGYALIEYLLPSPHVLLEPGALTVLVVKTQPGEVTCTESGRWKHRMRGKFFRQIAGQEAVGAPDLEAEHQTRKMKKWLARQLPETDIHVRAAIVFVNPEVVLESEASSVPALHAKKVKPWLRGPGRPKPWSADTRRKLQRALGVAQDQPADSSS